MNAHITASWLLFVGIFPAHIPWHFCWPTRSTTHRNTYSVLDHGRPRSRTRNDTRGHVQSFTVLGVVASVVVGKHHTLGRIGRAVGIVSQRCRLLAHESGHTVAAITREYSSPKLGCAEPHGLRELVLPRTIRVSNTKGERRLEVRGTSASRYGDGIDHDA